MKETTCRKPRFFGLLFCYCLLLLLGGCGGQGNGGGTSGQLDTSAVVFTADKDEDGKVELFLSKDNGTIITKLSDITIAGGDVVDFKVSPDGRRVAYLADQTADEVFAFYIVSIAGGAPAKVSDDLLANNLNDFVFKWAPDSSRLAYVADQDTPNVLELYTVRPDGTGRFRVSGNIVLGGNIVDFDWAPVLVAGSRQLAYRADQNIIGVVELFTTFAAADGSLAGNSIKVSGDLVVGRSVEAFKWSPDSQFIAYRANQTDENTIELYTTTPDVRSIVRISGTLLPRGREVREFTWSSDGRIAYVANRFGLSIFDLFTTFPQDAGGGTRISGPFVDGQEVVAFAWPPIGSIYIAYLANQDDTGIVELYTGTPGLATSGVRVSGPIPAGSGRNVTAFGWSPDGAFLAYIADQVTTTVPELFTTLPDSSPASPGDVRISATLSPGQEVIDFSWSPASSRAAYRANQDDIFKIELYSATPSGVTNDRVSGALVNNGNVVDYQWEPTGLGVAYIADQTTDQVFELFVSLPDGGDNTNVSGVLVPGGNVLAFAWVP